MAWDDALLPASFRGIPFFVDSHERTGGRNAVSHEPPDRDSSFAEDMGKRSDGYRITGHVLGDTYFFIRDALIEAMETREAGILIHPYLGLIDVQPKGFTFSEDTKEGRIGRFELNFVEAGDPNVVFASIDAVTGFVTNVVAAVAQVQNAMELAVAFSGLPGYAVESALSIHKSFTDTARNALPNIKANIDSLAQYNAKLDEFEGSGATSLISDTAAYASELDGVIEPLKDLPEEDDSDESNDTIDTKKEKADAVAIYDPLLDWAEAQKKEVEDKAPYATATREAEASNSLAIINAIKQLVIIRASEAAANQVYPSLEKAVAQRDALNDLIDIELNIEGMDDDLFQSLKDQKASNVALIPDPRKEVGTTKDIELLETTPSLALVYEEYGDVSHETEVIDRNRTENPAFMDGTVKVIKFG